MGEIQPCLFRGLEYYGGVNSLTNAAGGFVEFTVDAVRTPKCMIEFEGQRGKLTIQLSGHQPSEVVALAETLAKAER